MGRPVPAWSRRPLRRGLPLILVVISAAAAIAITSATGRTADHEAVEASAESTPAIEPPAPRRAAPARSEMPRPETLRAESSRAESGRSATPTTPRVSRPQARPSSAEILRTPVAVAVEAPAKPAASEAKGSLGDSLLGVGAKLLLGSLLLAGLLYGAARLVRRMPIAKLLPGADGPIKVIGRTHLGPKASLALVQTEGTTILVAVTPSDVRALHAWEGPAATGTTPLDRQSKTSREGLPTAATLPAQLRGLANRVTESR